MRHFDIRSLHWAYRYTIYWGALTRFWNRVTISGLENIPEEGPVLVVCNHQSYFDPLLISSVFPRLIHWMAKPELFLKKRLRKILVNNFVFPAARGTNSDLFLQGVAQKLKKDNVMGIFIQGGIEKPGQLREAKKGAATLASLANCQIVLSRIEGTRQLYAPKVLIPKLSKITCRFSEPFTLEKKSYSTDQLKEISEQWLDKIKLL